MVCRLWPPGRSPRSSATSTVAYATLNALHIFSIGLVVGSIAALDLRVLGLFRRFPLSARRSFVARRRDRRLLAAVDRLLLFSVRPLTYAENPAFLIKISLVAFGIMNALFFRTSWNWRGAFDDGRSPDSVRAAAFRSLLIWAGAVSPAAGSAFCSSRVARSQPPTWLFS